LNGRVVFSDLLDKSLINIMISFDKEFEVSFGDSLDSEIKPDWG